VKKVWRLVAVAVPKIAGGLAIEAAIADMERGRLVVDEPLANRVRSGRKQPQRARNGSLFQPPAFPSSRRSLLPVVPALTRSHAPGDSPVV